MFKKHLVRKYDYICVLGLLINPFGSYCCTGIRLTAKDGAVIYARTMEFVGDMNSEIITIPRNYAFAGTTPSGEKKGMQWKARYAAVGANALHANHIIDGFNEKGLGGGCFYLPGYAEYQDVTAEDMSKTVAPWELLTWILTTQSNVREAKNALKKVKVCKAVFTGWNNVPPPLHFVLHDATGASAVVEYVKGGKLTIYDNPLGVITNAPTFDWHITNLSNYMNLSAVAVPQIKLAGIKITPLGQGAGMLGLPGDFTPPSRFVRAVAFSQSIVPSKKAADSVRSAFHILNQFDIPIGSARTVEQGKTSFDYTQWTSASDLKNKKYYFHTFDNRQIRVADLMKFDFNAARITTVSMGQKEIIVNLHKT